MDLTPILYTAGAGAVGGLAYSYFYKLLTYATYLQAAGHLVAGAVAALLVVIASGAFSPPTDVATAWPLLIVGYGGTDVIDSFVQKLRTPTPNAGATSTAAGPPPTG